MQQKSSLNDHCFGTEKCVYHCHGTSASSISSVLMKCSIWCHWLYPRIIFAGRALWEKCFVVWGFQLPWSAIFFPVSWYICHQSEPAELVYWEIAFTSLPFCIKNLSNLYWYTRWTSRYYFGVFQFPVLALGLAWTFRSMSFSFPVCRSWTYFREVVKNDVWS